MNTALRQYLSRRNYEQGTQPSGARHRASNEPLRFVVQKHATRRAHYDLHLEVGGEFKSWAIPRGPSSDPEDTRLALKSKDHSLEYGEFEGSVPDGECGAGDVIVWDTGVYSPDGDGNFFFGDREEAEMRVEQALADGRLSLFFWGYKLAGSWMLELREGSEREWLLVKREDVFAEPARDLLGEERSVLSGRTLEDLRDEATDVEARRRRA